MQQEFYNLCVSWFSLERLNAYARRLPEATETTDILAYYFWNTALSQSLYPTIQAVEVAVRNSLHRTLSMAYGTEYWFNTPNGPALAPWQTTLISKVLADLEKRDRKRLQTLTPPQPLPGRVVAELSFGFWVGLFNEQYEPNRHTLWRSGRLTTVFPHLPRDESVNTRNRRKYRTRRALSAPLNRTLRLRNRISHHEPIWYWKDPPLINNLGEQHRELIELLSWIDPMLRDTVLLNDQFLNIYGNGPQPYRDDLDTFIATLP